MTQKFGLINTFLQEYSHRSLTTYCVWRNVEISDPSWMGDYDNITVIIRRWEEATVSLCEGALIKAESKVTLEAWLALVEHEEEREHHRPELLQMFWGHNKKNFRL